jgi:uroporphyrinogen decarboxylase
MTFQDVDRYPYFELGIWGQTYERWLREGLNEEDLVGDWFKGEPKFAMLDKREFIPLRLGPIPGFECKVLEENERYVVFTDQFGRKRRALKEGTARGTRLSMDTYLDFFVKDRADFLEMQKHYDPDEPSRYPSNWDELKRQYASRDYPLYLYPNCAFGGLYWNLREWMGTENLSYAFFDKPSLVHEMLDFFVDFFMRATKRALTEVEVDACIINEDFAYNAGPLISPKIYKEFFFPRHKAICEFLYSHGVKVIELDSDGNTEALLPMLIEAGFNCHWPLESAANMDPVKIRKKYGTSLALMGGIDKRELAKGKKAIEEELRRKVLPMLETGGYIPTVDHTIPPDVSLENALYYFELKRAIAEGKWR